MIVFKNSFEEAEENLSEPISFTINHFNVTISKNYSQLQELIAKIKKDNYELEIDISKLEQFRKEPHAILKKSRYSDSDDEDIYPCRYSNHTSNNSRQISVLHSNFDNRELQKNNKDNKSYSFNIYLSDHNNQKYLTSKNNVMINKIRLPRPKYQYLIHEKYFHFENCSSFAIEQFQLILNGYDIIITDFLLNDMIQIADKFQISELIENLDQLNEEVKNLANYNRFSEIEILIYLEELLTSINENNFEEKSKIVYSIFLYTGENLFGNILHCFSLTYPKKYPIYLKIAEIIKEKYDFKFDVTFEKKEPEIKYSYIKSLYGYNIKKSKKINENLLEMIKNDDSDSLQKLACNPQFKFSEEFVIIEIYESFKNVEISPECNAIECAAFYGSLNCFKYLKLNENLDSDNLARYAIAGGNTEIIHICEQQKCNFRNTLKIAIDYHQNEIAEWIVDNNKDIIREDIYEACINACNFDMLQFFLDRKAESTLNNTKLIMKYVLYIDQNYNVMHEKSDLLIFMTQFRSMKFNDDFGLIYCPNEKIELLNILLSNNISLLNLLTSPIKIAAYKGNFEMCQFLLNYKKQHQKHYDIESRIYEYINGRDLNINLQLMIEQDYEDSKIYIFLGLMMFTYIFLNYYPIYYAVLSGSLETVKLFIEKDSNIKNKALNENPLHFAAIKNEVEIGKILLEKYDINSTDNAGHTALNYAIKNHSKEFIQFLLNQPGIDINIQDIEILKTQ